jgi:hypothetical protein
MSINTGPHINKVCLVKKRGRGWILMRGKEGEGRRNY